MKNTNTTIGDLINPQVKNILAKYKRLSFISEEMGIDKTKSQDLKYLQNLPEHKKHKHYQELQNLITKLLKIKK
jgi:hypothetical protein|tara:strand:+ start:1374 stop:1595 length:222 start_codon:yes stop_codon:yes gene_type:complete